MFMVFLFSAEIHAGIVDAVMKDAGQDKIKAPGYYTQVLERQVAHAQLVIEEEAGDDAAGEHLYPVERRVFEGP
jgi:hypothetical protein